MTAIKRHSRRKRVHQTLRRLFHVLPAAWRFAIYRRMIDCDPAPDPRLELKIAQTPQELQECFRLLHDAYVGSGFMKPDPSGMRVTIYHALPTTTTLCAIFDGKVVGTLSLIRESAIGFPLQRIFDLTSVRAKRGNIAEVSALAIHPAFQGLGGMVLLPLLKFLYEYCTSLFDTRHLVIAVHPRHIETYESLLFFRRLSGKVVPSYDFVNGAPAVGATLDLKHAPEILRKHYGNRPLRRNLHHYFVDMHLPNIEMPARRFYTTNDPVLTPDLIDYFFNVRTDTFRNLSPRKKVLLHTIYDLPEYRAVLPELSEGAQAIPIRRHERFSVRCPARLLFQGEEKKEDIPIEIFEVSKYGFQAHASKPLPFIVWFDTTVELGRNDVSHLQSLVLRSNKEEPDGFYGFRLGEPDILWRKFVSALYHSKTYSDLETPTRFLR